MTARPLPVRKATRLPVGSARVWARDNGWMLGLLVFMLVLLAFTKVINPFYDVSSLQGLATSVLPLALAALAQTVVVIAGGIDLSISSQMALTSCIAAVLMQRYPGDATAIAIVAGVLLVGLLLGAINGGLVVLTGVPDIIVTLATSFIFAGFALLVTPRPAGAAAGWLKDLVVGPLVNFPILEWIPRAVVVLIVIAAVIIQAVVSAISLRKISEDQQKISEDVRRVAEMEGQTQRLILDRLTTPNLPRV